MTLQEAPMLSLSINCQNDNIGILARNPALQAWVSSAPRQPRHLKRLGWSRPKLSIIVACAMYFNHSLQIMSRIELLGSKQFPVK
jgi:hypothetical protein